ncbi:MAG: two-component regulator propeller domain-containing protein [Chitinophagaceae bacterium]
MRARWLLLIISLVSYVNTFSQAPQLKFLHLDTEQGLTDGAVRAITQDKYGYMWLGTQYGLCRYDSYHIIPYFHNDTDSLSLGGNFIWSAYTDSDGDVWVGDDYFLSKYNYNTNNFTNYTCGYAISINKITEDEKGFLWLATSQGLMRFDKRKEAFTLYKDHTDIEVKKAGAIRINDLFLDKEKGFLYLATQEGFKIFDYNKEKIVAPFLKNNNDPYLLNETIISTVTKDKNGAIWFGCGFINSVMVRWDPSTNTTRYYNDFTEKSKGWSENRTLSLFTDKEGNLWAGGVVSNLSLYLPGKDEFHHYQNDALLKSSIEGSDILTIYQDRAGMIWAGTQGHGAERFFFKNLFTAFQPQASVQPSLLNDWGRAALEDSRGDIWFGTAKGISVYDPATGLYKNYFNDDRNPALISFNTIRSLAEDKKSNIWIGTGNGLTRFDPVTGRFRLYDFNDSMNIGFVWSLLVTHTGDLFASGTGGLQRYNPATDKFTTIDSDSLNTKKFRFNIRNMFEDSKHGLWLGVYDGGLIYYHPEKKEIKHYRHNKNDSTSLCNNFVTSVIEDKNGIIWIATRDGLSSLDTKTGIFTSFSTADGLPSNKTSGLRIDAANRLWIATGNGLSMLMHDRRTFRNFDVSDGLPTNQFNDQVASTTHDGKFIYPTLRGFFMFNPEEVHQKILSPPLVYASAFKVFNTPVILDKNAEEIKELKLRYNRNFFSIELTALNYESPGKVVYAYKLEPFDKDWTYTKEKTITYTNVPGGNYIFYYKATVDPSDWNVPVHDIRVTIGTVFYKTTWFMLLALALLAGLIYGIYKYRLRQARKVHHLQLQAARLEKDKTEIQYQHLINQFNPHFLFNSLTSLNSLIYENKELASEFLEQLSKVYRYLLTHKETQLVTLETEIDFVKNYIALLKTRFENGLQIEMNIPEGLLQRKVVPVTFQLMIENAIKHNVIDEGSPLVIHFFADEKYLYVSNNIQKKGYVETSNRKGLNSLQVLYKYLSSLPMTINETTEKFTISIPLL